MDLYGHMDIWIYWYIHIYIYITQPQLIRVRVIFLKIWICWDLDVSDACTTLICIFQHFEFPYVWKTDVWGQNMSEFVKHWNLEMSTWTCSMRQRIQISNNPVMSLLSAGAGCYVPVWRKRRTWMPRSGFPPHPPYPWWHRAWWRRGGLFCKVTVFRWNYQWIYMDIWIYGYIDIYIYIYISPSPSW